MSSIRLLNTGEWSKPPVLTIARRIFIKGLGEHIPKATLGSIASFVNGTSYDTGKLSGDGTPIIRISNITNPESDFLKTAQEFDSRFLASRGDLLVSWSASFKSIIWPKERGIVNQHIFKVTEEPGYHRGFIRHTIEAVFDDLQENVVGIGMKHLRRRDFLEYPVPNPDFQTQKLISDYLDWLENRNGEPEPQLPTKLSEQRRIVRRLEHLASKIEEARGLSLQAQAQTNALLQAKISDAVRGIALDGTLSDRLLDKPRNGWSAKCDNLESGTPVLTLSAVTGFHYNGSEHKRTSLPTNPDAHYWLEEGDLLITRSNSPELVGHLALYDGYPSRCIYPDLMMRLKIDEKKVSPRFVLWFMQSEAIRDYIKGNAKGTSPSMKKINQQTVMNIPFPSSLSLETQDQIASSLDSLQANVDNLKQLQAQTRGELEALLPSVLDKAFRGEL